MTVPPVLTLADVGLSDRAIVGAKAARLGELIRAGFPVPAGFVLTAEIHRAGLEAAGVIEPVVTGMAELVGRPAGSDRDRAVEALRVIADLAELSDPHRRVVLAAYRSLSDPAAEHAGTAVEPAVAVRSSAIDEDSSDASFAGVHDSVIDVIGADAVLAAVQHCWSSAVSTRSVSYRSGLSDPDDPTVPSGSSARSGPIDVAMAVIVQRMAPTYRSGVMFTVDPRTGGADRLVIEATGTGRSVVSGESDPDRFEVDRTSGIIVRAAASIDPDATGSAAGVLTHREVAALNEVGRRIEEHLGATQDIEWSMGSDGSIWVVQSRPITARRDADAPVVSGVGDGTPSLADPVTVLTGVGASAGVATGPVRVLRDPFDAADLIDGEVLVAPTTSPEWMPALMAAVAVVTDTGGMASHAAIVARERGVPCVVGVRGATDRLVDGEVVTVDGAAGSVRRERRS